MADKLIMQRSVSQLLFHYLPGRMVDWEGGLAITYLNNVHFSSLWPADRASIVLDELSRLFERWRRRGGEVDRSFPDPTLETGNYTVGTPEWIDATALPTGLVCPRCSRLIFVNVGQLGGPTADAYLQCPSCSRRGMRQIGQIFVHGCGEFATVDSFVPAMKPTENGSFTPTKNPIACPKCRASGALFFQNRTDRLKDLSIECRTCNTVVRQRLTASCPKCLRDVVNSSANPLTDSDTSIPAKVAMRMTRYSASSAYYPQNFSILRLDRPAVNFVRDDELLVLEHMSPGSASGAQTLGLGGTVEFLGRKLAEAESSGDVDEADRIRAQITTAVTQGMPSPPTPTLEAGSAPTAADMQQAVREAIAFRTTVLSQDAIGIARQAQGASSMLLEDVENGLQRMGITRLSLVDDLPIVSATFGYTRRTFEHTYRELSADLPTRIRPFSPVDDYESRRHNKPEIAGTVPILAREGEHEGIFLSLSPSRVLEWLKENGVVLEESDAPPISRIAMALEDVDRYYDDIWQKPVRRLLFGLIHSLSHAAMRAAGRFAGIERTSFSEYLFLPLLGTVIYDNSSSFKLGGFEAMVRDRLLEFTSSIAEEAMSCLYDPQCIDHKGACHGCIHSPDISCRVFNHGLSRAFLIGGHAPWADISDEQRVVGYWE